MKLLIVEDNTRMRQLIRSLVTDLAEEIFECGDGADAVTLYTQHLPDWVLMDVELPLVDGILATRQIKTAFPQAQILIVTQYDDTGIRQEAEAAGACGYVLKENLLEVRQLLQRGATAGK